MMQLVAGAVDGLALSSRILRALIPDALGSIITALNVLKGAVPKYDGQYDAAELGLDEPATAEILRDEQGSPTIVAATEADVFALHGVCVGQDRLWQIHQSRLAACGRLAEIKPVALKLDIFARQLGLARLGAEDWDALNADPANTDAVVMVKSFVRGVNWAANQRRAQGEMFMLTGSPWEELTPAQLCAVVRLVAFGMSNGWQHALIRQWMQDTFGAEAGSELSHTADGGGEPAGACTGDSTADGAMPIPRTVDAEMSAAFAAIDPADLAWAHGPAGLPKGQGSNWCVVNGQATSTGKPLMCGDPHLKVSPLPGFWYRVTYRGAVNAAGLAMAAIPGVVIGHNGDICWSVTLGYCDVEDAFLERFNSDGQYEHCGAWHEPEVWEEAFSVKGVHEPTIVQMRRTVHGPVLDQPGNLFRMQPMATDVVAAAATDDAAAATGARRAGTTYGLAYAGLPTRPKTLAFVGLRRMLEARDYASFDAALAYASTVISLNFSFASTSGHIGYVLCGEVPRGRGDGGSNVHGGDEWYPLCGWSGKHDYTGWVPHAELPKAFDPPSHLIVSANHALVDYDSYPHYLGNVYRAGYRAARLHALLGDAARAGRVTTEMLIAAQLDVTSIAAQQFARIVQHAQLARSGLQPAEAQLARATLEALRGWDGELSAASEVASLYQLMHAELVLRLVRCGVQAKQGAQLAGREAAISADLLKDDAMRAGSVLENLIHGVAADGVFKQVNELAGHLHRNVLRMLHAGARGDDVGTWWLAQAGGFHVAVCEAACAAEQALAKRKDRRWGALHQTTLAHPLTAALGFEAGTFLDLPCLPSGGDANTPCQIAPASLSDMSATSTHVSARVVFDLSDIAHKSYVSTPLGTCEVAGSSHRADTTQAWHKGDYDPIRWEMDDIREHTKYRMSFVG